MKLTEIESCYVAALIDGLRLIDEKESESGKTASDLDWNALCHYVSAKGKQIAAAVGLKVDPKEQHSRSLVLIAKKDWYYKNRDRISQQRKERYRQVAEVIRIRVREYVAQNRDKVLNSKRLYREAHRRVLADKQLSRYHNYYKFRDSYLERRSEYRESRRTIQREWSRQRSEALTDGYVRELLAKNTTKSSRDFTSAEVEEKRARILDKRARKLTDEECEHIRTDPRSARELSEFYGVCISTIFNIRSGRTRQSTRVELKEAA